MRTLAIEKDAERIRHLFDTPVKEVVRVERNGKVMGIVIPAEDAEFVRQAYGKRCAQILQRNAKHAGLTPQEAEELVYGDN